jgi:hypothetical protein
MCTIIISAHHAAGKPLLVARGHPTHLSAPVAQLGILCTGSSWQFQQASEALCGGCIRMCGERVMQKQQRQQQTCVYCCCRRPPLTHLA